MPGGICDTVDSSVARWNSLVRIQAHLPSRPSRLQQIHPAVVPRLQFPACREELQNKLDEPSEPG